MISLAGKHFDFVAFAFAAIPSTAVALIVLSARDALREMRRAGRHAMEASS